MAATDGRAKAVADYRRLLENLCNLDEIPAPYHSFTVSVLPVKWRGASGAPVRAIAIVAS